MQSSIRDRQGKGSQGVGPYLKSITGGNMSNEESLLKAIETIKGYSTIRLYLTLLIKTIVVRVIKPMYDMLYSLSTYNYTLHGDSKQLHSKGKRSV